MAEDKSKTVIVKARAKAFLTSQPEENDPLTAVTAHKRTVSKLQKSAPSAAEIAAAIRKGEASEAVKNISVDSAADAKKSTVVVVMRQEPIINRKNKLTEDGRVKKIPACKMAEPMKRPADDTLIISGRVVAASKKIQTPAAAVTSVTVKAEEVKAVKPAAKPEPEKTETKPTAKPAVKKAEPKKATAKPAVKKAEPKKAAAKPAVKKAEPKKTAAKPAVKKAEPKKAAAKPAAKKAEPKKAAMVQNTYIQYQNETYNEADLVALAEKLWTKDMKKKAADLKSLELYIKPQERMAYCVFNKKETGSFAI
ncbi:MAG: hypothetical protein K2K96_06455 [Lachnospiraceae bacterium]|nr:hypothetical protein [Lachnospiraceae bacterium]